jgi:predicted amidohydrolase
MNIRVGLAQLSPVLGDVPTNLALHLESVQAAVARSLDLLVFPELSLTGYHVGDQAYDLAIRTTREDPTFARLLAASREIDLVVSFIEEDERYRYTITAVYLSGGEMVHRHRKVYLPTYGLFDEARLFSPGHEVRSFETRFGRMGLLICEDLWHPSLAYLLWLDGADVLIGLSASLEHGAEGVELGTSGRVDAILRTYALLYTQFVLHVNRTGTEEGLSYWGGSTVFEPNGERLIQGPLNEPGLVEADLDLTRLRSARIELPLLRDERPDLTARTLARILERHDD